MATSPGNLLGLTGGQLQAYLTANVSAGSGNAGYVPVLNASGVVDVSMMPAGPPSYMVRPYTGAVKVLGAISSAAPTTAPFTAPSSSYQPFMVTEPITIANLGAIVSTAATGTANIGIYSNNSGGTYDVPNVLLGSVTGLSTGTAGAISGALASSITLLPGVLYWMAVGCTAAASFRSYALAGGMSLGFVSGGNAFVCRYTNTTLSSLPTPFASTPFSQGTAGGPVITYS